MRSVSTQGLYEPFFEHDNCGFGFVANIDGRQEHKVVTRGIKVLERLVHRGACGCDPETGDGAGLLFQTPYRFFAEIAKELGIELPEPGAYSPTMVFFPKIDGDREACRAIIEKYVVQEGQTILGWRDVPRNPEALGWLAREGEPDIQQVFIKKADGLDTDEFERKLYVIRKQIEHEISASDIAAKDEFYIPSMSARTIVYKGLMLAYQIAQYYTDLADERFETSIALCHQRYSTNTMPKWKLAHPFRFVCHNGEFNTLRGNINMMRSRESKLSSPLYGDDIKKILPVLTPGASDSASFDEAFELLVRSGRDMSHAMGMMIPEPWSGHESMRDDIKAFYEYHASMMEPWDGPAAVAFSDGVRVGAMLDRNGLRPSRYWITDDDFVVVASEVGVLDEIPEASIRKKGRLEPGRTFLIDTEKKHVISNEEIKNGFARRQNYRSWLNIQREDLPERPKTKSKIPADSLPLIEREMIFGYTKEDREIILGPMSELGKEPIGSMGNDVPLAVLSDRPQLLFNYFKQLFAQVTNPPIDPIREEIVMSLETSIGNQCNLLKETEEHCRQLHLKSPVITNEQLQYIRDLDDRIDENKPPLLSRTISTLFDVTGAEADTEKTLERICAEAEKAVDEGITFLILSDRGVSPEKAPMPILMACGGLHHYLVGKQKRSSVGIICETGEAREVMHMCLLTGYGAGAVNPYMAFDIIDDLLAREIIIEKESGKAKKNYIKGLEKGLLKTMSKIGISTQHSYRNAQIFEAVGIGSDVIDRCFLHTPSRVGGIGFAEVTTETLLRHGVAYPERQSRPKRLDPGGQYRWRHRGEFHQINPFVVEKVQMASKKNSWNTYKEYADYINDRTRNLSTLRGLLKFKETGNSIPLEEVESAKEIVKRFCTGAMSFGSISKESHENLAIAMNRLGGRSNTGEGGEDPRRFNKDDNGDLRRSAIKQVASGRFGVTNEYLVNSDEIQIKMAQGAKPGEGGQLPGTKVFGQIAKVRYATPGVELISPPPHHDIYSIEDLAQLIHDLKNANVHGNVSVKLVSAVGVGTIAAGVSKGKADLVLISGAEGGTGASPLSSIKHAGLPWELGLSETHQVLVENDLRSRIRVQTDGQMKTGRDAAVAFLLGADEVGYATMPLIVSGCIMMRKCHLNTCPVGIATQDEALRAKFEGKPEHVVNFFFFVAEEIRQIMADLGIRTVDEMIGRTDLLEFDPLPDHWKAKTIDLSRVLYQPKLWDGATRHHSNSQDHGIDAALDNELMKLARPALEKKARVHFSVDIQNINRTVGTMLSSEMTRRHNLGIYGDTLPEDTIWIDCLGAAGQSFGAFSIAGITFNVVGEANDYFGKGLSGGKLIVSPSPTSKIIPEENIVCGNVALYGATSGECYIRGIAGERFCVRNSGAWAVVEGVGDHGCEYMTGGRAVILGKTGRNFAAGMSGGIAFVYDEDDTFDIHCNREQVDIKPLHEESIGELRMMLERHMQYTGSTVAQNILENWEDSLSNFKRVMPRDYARVLREQHAREEEEMTHVPE
jgi:glutamate synthase domain-containing protein 2/glutamate synthase domain-containing protein 1/glutamate synthase domain-containing protein 3